MTTTAERANLVLPAVPATEREGTYTSGERRLQRFNPAATPIPGPRADFAITAQIGKRLNLDLEGRTPALVLLQIADEIPGYAGMSYQKLAETREQWPIVGGNDLYFGGTAHANKQGLGAQLGVVETTADLGEMPGLSRPKTAKDTLWVLPITCLYDNGTTIWPSELLRGRMAKPVLRLHPKTAANHGFGEKEGQSVEVSFNQVKSTMIIELDNSVPEGVALLPRSVGVPIMAPETLIIRQLNTAKRD
jgi:NADH-quinone oxidoreductase subunit G